MRKYHMQIDDKVHKKSKRKIEVEYVVKQVMTAWEDSFSEPGKNEKEMLSLLGLKRRLNILLETRLLSL